MKQTEQFEQINQIIGAEVKRLRKKLKMRQTQLAPLLGLDQSALSRVENGDQMLSAAQWVLLCNATGTRDRLTRLVMGRVHV